MNDIDKLLDDLQHGRHVSLVDLPEMLNELRDLRRLRERVEAAPAGWVIVDGSGNREMKWFDVAHPEYEMAFRPTSHKLVRTKLVPVE